MSNSNLDYNNNVKYYLKTDGYKAILIEEPDGWSDDHFNLKRHDTMHGLFKNLSNQLKFKYKEAEYINKGYKLNGINCKTTLTRMSLHDVNNEIKFVVDYIAFADYETKVEKDNFLYIKFETNELESLIEAHKTDEFDVDRIDSINDKIITELETYNTEIKGRRILQSGESILKNGYEHVYDVNFIQLTPITEIVSQGPNRHSSVDTKFIGDGSVGSNNNPTASNMFFVNSGDINISKIKLDIEYDIIFSFGEWINVPYISSTRPYACTVEFQRYKYNEQTARFILIETFIIYDKDNLTATNNINLTGKLSIDLFYDEGVLISYYNSERRINKISKQNIKLSINSFYESSPSLKFMFVHDLFDRFLEIFTGVKGLFYSKYFGRKDKSYNKDGFGAFIGIIYGMWVRDFIKGSDKYKGLTLNLDDLMKSVHSVFNVGYGIHKINGVKKLRCEDLKFFYQNRVGITLPYEIQNEELIMDKTLFFSGISTGYSNGGSYGDSMGLDEPNTRTNRITPIKYSKNKFEKISKINSDEYGLEEARRKPQINYPNEDTKYDDLKWFLDLKKKNNNYTQVDWQDRLIELPSGVHSPETFRSFLFTPLRILKRHSWVWRAGIEQYLNKNIKFISSKSNSNLKTWFIDEQKPYVENEDILIKDFSRSRFKPEIIKFNHPVSKKLMDDILSYKKIEWEGSEENVPMYYFKFKFLTKTGKYKSGYLMELNLDNGGTFKILISNEDLLK